MNSLHSLQRDLQSEQSYLLQLEEEVKRTSSEVKKRLGSISGRFVLCLADRLGYLPDFVKCHLVGTKALHQAIKVFQEQGKFSISPDVMTTLKEGQQLVRNLTHKLHGELFLKVLTNVDQDVVYLDRQRFLFHPNAGWKKTILPSHLEWHLNLGLLMNFYQRTEDSHLKKLLSFLALNYLAKGAPYGFDELGLNRSVEEKLNQMFHHGLIEPGIVYNRESLFLILIYILLLSINLLQQAALIYLSLEPSKLKICCLFGFLWFKQKVFQLKKSPFIGRKKLKDLSSHMSNGSSVLILMITLSPPYALISPLFLKNYSIQMERKIKIDFLQKNLIFLQISLIKLFT